MTINITSITIMETTFTTAFPEMMVDKLSFSWYDYILFILMLSVSAAIGVYFGYFDKSKETVNEYLMGGHNMKVFPIAMSLIASHVSGITLLAVPAEVYRFGATYLLMIFASVITVIVTNYIYLPIFFKLQIMTTFEYLEKRFDVRSRQLASFLFGMLLFLYLPVVIYIPALAFSAATGLDIHYVTPLVCGVCIFYTTIGGIKAVVWTDTFQFTITSGAVVVVFILGIRSTGGILNIWDNAIAGRRLDNIVDFDLDPTKRDTFWSATTGITFLWISVTSINQGSVQKFLSLPTLAKAKRSVIYYIIGVALISATSVFTGLIMYAKYANCDPFTTGAVVKNDQLLPYYVMDVAGNIPGLPGLFIAGVFCAGLSTLSANLNSLAGTIYEDFILKIYSPNSDKETNSVLKILVVIIGVICTAMVFIVEKCGAILPLQIALGSVTQGPLLGLFTLGVFFPRVNRKGAFYGTIIGLIFIAWITFTSMYYKSQNIITYEPKPTSVQGCLNETELTTSFPSIVSENFASNFTTEKIYSEKISEEEFTPFILFRITHYYYAALGFFGAIIPAVLISYVTNKEGDPPVHKDVLSPLVHFLLPDDKKNLLDVKYHSVVKDLEFVFEDKIEK